MKKFVAGQPFLSFYLVRYHNITRMKWWNILQGQTGISLKLFSLGKTICSTECGLAVCFGFYCFSSRLFLNGLLYCCPWNYENMAAIQQALCCLLRVYYQSHGMGLCSKVKLLGDADVCVWGFYFYFFKKRNRVIYNIIVPVLILEAKAGEKDLVSERKPKLWSKVTVGYKDEILENQCILRATSSYFLLISHN